ncbi:hypothetical protein OPV22_009574 [Ensete ventricosum]|uniref:Protein TRIGALACTOSYLDIACYLGLYCEROL 4, chloroplastic n=1 Tax=Ensete ventricosum TaxID=4639 RepID=A0AAV8RJE2_ENSVE|nr:hypothetical protein OPV22_009574 [Ensete ventricosum]
MASLRLAMDAAFWDLNVSSAQSLEGTARAVPGEAAPLGMARASRLLRPRQLSFLSRAFPLGLVPSFSPTPRKDLGSFAIQSLLLGPSSDWWWMALVGQFRPRKLISNIKKEVTMGDELEWPQFKDVARHFLDKSLYALGLFSQISLTPETSLLFNVERHGDKTGRRAKAMLLHELPGHDVTIEATWPELFLDSKGNYWDVPTSVSLDVASLIPESGLRYRFGLHKNGGQPEALNSSSPDIPLTLLPGVCAKAAVSYEKSMDFWREQEKSTRARRLVKEPARVSSYDEQLREPHATISGIIGGTYAAWFGDGNISNPKRSNQFHADFFGSLCYTIQLGKFNKDFNDLTRISARLDICSASAFMKGVSHLISDTTKGRVDTEFNPLATPRLNVILQQQVAGPIVFSVDSRVSLGSPSGKRMPCVDDAMCGLSYSFRKLKSGKILAWYSPKRKEAMVELRLFEL